MWGEKEWRVGLFHVYPGYVSMLEIYIYIYIYIVCVWIIESFFLSRSGLLLVLEKKERGGKKKLVEFFHVYIWFVF